jgi:SAM-dependent methyltransferase
MDLPLRQSNRPAAARAVRRLHRARVWPAQRTCTTRRGTQHCCSPFEMSTVPQNQDVAAFEAMSEDAYLESQGRRFDRTIEVLKSENATVPWIEFGALGGGFATQCAQSLGLERSQMFCCDFTPQLLRRAAERGFATCVWDLEAGARPAELRSGTFKTILFCEIIEHLVAPDRTLRAVVDLLAPGGLLLVTTPNLASLGNRIRLLRGRTPSLNPAPGASIKAPGSLASYDHLRVCVTDEWTYLLESFGLQVTRVEGCTSTSRTTTGTMRRRLTVGLNILLEQFPGRLWQTTIIAARKP